jgi:DNA polymerase-3 subunit gamma/tau
MQKIEQLEHELTELKKNGIMAKDDGAAAAVQKKPQRSSRKGFQAPVGKVNEVLKQATKNDLIAIKSRWGEMLDRLVHNQMRSQAALLNEAEPVAASETALIVKFKYEIHCQMAMDNSRFLETLANVLFELLGKRVQLVGIPDEQWQQVREEFLRNQRDGDDEGEGFSKSEEDPHVAEAVKLFGPELIEIKE